MALRQILTTILGKNIGLEDGGALIINKRNGVQIALDAPSGTASPYAAIVYDSSSGQLYVGSTPVPLGGAGITSAELATTTGTPGAMYSLTDGDDAGAKLTWAIPSGSSAYTWCWWLWPQAAYEA